MVDPYRATDIWNAIKAGQPVHISMEFSAQGVVVEDEDIDISSGLTIVDSMDSGGRAVAIGKVSCKQLTATILINDKTRNIRWKDRFRLKLGVKVNNSILWSYFGYFNGTTPKKSLNATVIEYVAYDDMVKFDVDAEKFINSIEVPILREDFLKAMCKYAGVGFTAPPENPSLDYWNVMSIGTKDQLTDYSTLREILEAITEATCTNAKIVNGYLYLTWYGERQIVNNQPVIQTIARTDEFSLEYEEAYDAVKWSDVENLSWSEIGVTTWGYIGNFDTINNVIDAVRIKDDDSPWGGATYYDQSKLHIDNCTNVYTIKSSEFTKYVNQADAQNIYTRLHSLGNILPLVVECTGNYNLEAGDLVNVTIEDGSTVTVPVCYKTLRIAGDITDTIELTSNK